MDPLTTRDNQAPALTCRQRDVADLVEAYQAVAGEMPSAAWIGRQLSISRRRALQHVEALRRKGWCKPARARA